MRAGFGRYSNTPVWKALWKRLDGPVETTKGRKAFLNNLAEGLGADIVLDERLGRVCSKLPGFDGAGAWFEVLELAEACRPALVHRWSGSNQDRARRVTPVGVVRYAWKSPRNENPVIRAVRFAMYPSMIWDRARMRAGSVRAMPGESTRIPEISRPMEPTASHVLVQRARQRDSAAIAILFDRYRDKLRRALRRKLGENYRRALLDSEDAVQDGILAAISSLEQFEYQGSGSFLAWVLRVAEREVLQRVRAQQTLMRDRRRQVDLEDAGDPVADIASPSQVAQGHETEQLLQQCLEELGEREREVIVLRRYLDLDASEIHVEMKLPSPGAARALLSRAQTQLAAMLDRRRSVD